MKLKEQYYENNIVRLLKEYNDKFGDLITEAKSVDTLVKVFDMSESEAKLFEKIFKSISVWMANKIAEHYVKELPNFYPTIQDVMGNIGIEDDEDLIKKLKELK